MLFGFKIGRNPQLFLKFGLFLCVCAQSRLTPLSMELSRQEGWSGLPFPSSGDLPHQGIEPTPLMSLALAGGLFTTWEAQIYGY